MVGLAMYATTAFDPLPERGTSYVERLYPLVRNPLHTAGNWLTAEQSQVLWQAPNPERLKVNVIVLSHPFSSHVDYKDTKSPS